MSKPGLEVCPAGESAREASLLVCEETWMARVEALTVLLEEVEVLAGLAHLSQRARLSQIQNRLANARLRDLTEGEE